MILNLKGKPYPKQIDFMKATHTYINYGGSRGGGKSWCGRRKALLMALNPDYAGIQILFLRRRYNDVYENHIFPLQQELYGFCKYRPESKSFDFPWGSRIIFGYCDHEKDVLQYQGKAFDVIFIEEATQFTSFMIQCLTESLRPSGLMRNQSNFPNCRMYFTCNPGGVGHAEIKRLFIDRSFKEAEDPDDYLFIPSTVYENDFLMKSDPKYVKRLEALPEQRRKAMLYGDWNVYEGQFFTDFTDNPEGYEDRKWTHVIKPFQIPASWRRYRSLDWGYSKPFSIGWWAVDNDGRAYRYREWYGWTGEPDVGLRYTPSQVAEEIKKIEAELEPDGVEHITGVADPAIFATQTGESVAETMEKLGVYHEPGDNKRLAGWDQMRERMRFDNEGYPLFYIFDTCRQFIRTIPSLIHDETKVEDLDTKQEDHIADESRYFCMARPVPPRIIIPAKAKIYNPLDTEVKPSVGGLGFIRSI